MARPTARDIEIPAAVLLPTVARAATHAACWSCKATIWQCSELLFHARLETDGEEGPLSFSSTRLHLDLSSLAEELELELVPRASCGFLPLGLVDQCVIQAWESAERRFEAH